MTTTPVELAPEAHEPRYAPVASYVHTAFLVVLIFAMSWFSANAPKRSLQSSLAIVKRSYASGPTRVTRLARDESTTAR